MHKNRDTFTVTMWHFASNALAGSMGPRNGLSEPSQATTDCSDDEVSPCNAREEELECPICWESFNIVENVPYVLWCGHTLCKNCVLGLQRAVVKFRNLPIQLPLLISCPWCHLLSCRLVYKGNLKFPRKNYFLLWMVKSMNGEREIYSSSCCADQLGLPSSSIWAVGNDSHHQRNLRRVPQQDHSQPDSNHANRLNLERIQSSFRKFLSFFVHLTAKLPLVLTFILVVVYAIPASAAILILYILVTILFALPSFLVLYFAYPSLDWLVKEIMN